MQQYAALLVSLTALLSDTAYADTGAACTSSFYGTAEASNGVVYKNVAATGSYNDVATCVNFAAASSEPPVCSSTPKAFSGPLGPLAEELAVAIRGPLVLQKFAAYGMPSSNNKKKRSAHRRRRHIHNHRRHAGVKHSHKRRKHKRNAICTKQNPLIPSEPASEVQSSDSGEPTAPAYGYSSDQSVQPTVPAYGGSSGQSTAPAEPPQTAPASAETSAGQASDQETTSPAQETTSPAQGYTTGGGAASTNSAAQPTGTSSPSTGGSSGGSWSRSGYYDGTNAHGITFLSKDGSAFSHTLGNGVGYLLSSGSGTCPAPEVLAANTQLKSDQQITIATDKPCQDGDCGPYTFPGAAAMHGWGGTQKAFVWTFKMPNDQSGSNYPNQPSIWLLNSRIVNVAQFAFSAGCSCWSSGCGEMDVFEVICTDTTKAISQIHAPGTSIDGGNSNYWKRPTDGFITFSVLMDGDEIYLTELSGFDYPESLDADTLAKMKPESGAVTSF